MLTARDAVEDRVAGLDAGADDYLTKPFSFAELLARLRALARRGAAERPAVLEVGDLRLDPATRQVWRGEAEIELSAKEFALLETFMRRPGQVLSRYQLLEHAWDYAYENRSNVVDVYVRYLREKIDRPFGRASLETVRGVGYRLRGTDGVSRCRSALRLTLAFALAMAVVLAARRRASSTSGSATRSTSSSTRACERARRSVAALVRAGPGRSAARRRRGRASRRCSAPTARRRARRPGSATPLLTAERERARAGRSSSTATRAGVDGGRMRLLVDAGGDRVVVVGASLEDRDEALAGLLAAAPRRRARSRCCSRRWRATSLAGGGAAAGRGDAPPSGRDLGDAAGRRLPLPRGATTRSPPRRDAERRCSAGSRPASRASAASSPTRATSCGRRSRCSRPSSSSRCAGRARRRSSRPRSRSAGEETDRLARLAEDLLVLARADEGRAARCDRRADPGARAARGGRAALRPRAAATAGRDARGRGADGARVAGDRLRLEQALGNLVDNALRHGAGTVRLEARRAATGRVELRGRATRARGFPPDFLPRAFERFTRERRGARRGAAGLGLAIVDAIARAHGGSAPGRERAGGGAVVTLALPGESGRTV